MNSRFVCAALVCLAYPALARAGNPELKLPSFAHLQTKATHSVDITHGRLPLWMTSLLMDDDDPESAEVKKMLRGLKTIRVLSYEFDSDAAYSRRDIDAVRSQLSRPSWSSVARVSDRNMDEDVDVYFAVGGDKITGLAVIVSEPREFTIVNIVGAIDLEKLHQLEGQFGIPKLQLDDGKEKAK